MVTGPRAIVYVIHALKLGALEGVAHRTSCSCLTGTFHRALDVEGRGLAADAPADGATCAVRAFSAVVEVVRTLKLGAFQSAVNGIVRHDGGTGFPGPALWRCPIRCETAFAAFPAVGDGGEGGAGGTARRCLLADRVKAALQRLLALVGAVHDAGVDGIRHLRLQQGLRHVLLLAGCRYEIRWLH